MTRFVHLHRFFLIPENLKFFYRRFKSETLIVRNLVVELVAKNLVKPVGAGTHEVAGKFKKTSK